MAQRLPVVALWFGGLQPVCDSAQGGAGAARSEVCAFSTHRIMRTRAHWRRASLTGGHAAPVVTGRVLQGVAFSGLTALASYASSSEDVRLRYATLHRRRPRMPSLHRSLRKSAPAGAVTHPLYTSCLRTYVPTSSTWSAK
jgi:hypothetical protein